MSASFGGPPPVGLKELHLANPSNGCQEYNQDLSDKIIVAQRGECSFFLKAQMAYNSKASALVIVNSEDRLEPPSAGLGIESSVTENLVNQLNRLSIVIKISLLL